MEPVAFALIKERKNVLSRLRDHERIVCGLQTTIAHIDATLFPLMVREQLCKRQRSFIFYLFQGEAGADG